MDEESANPFHRRLRLIMLAKSLKERAQEIGKRLDAWPFSIRGGSLYDQLEEEQVDCRDQAMLIMLEAAALSRECEAWDEKIKLSAQCREPAATAVANKTKGRL